VYPRRHPKFVVPFAIAVFAAAGVAPLVISNPMNMVFADHVGLAFNRYSLTMIPVAVVGWFTTYHVLAWVFRDALADADPALGVWPRRPPSLGWAERVALATVIAVLAAYPIVSYLDLALWPVAVAGGAICGLVCRASGRSFAVISDGVAWALFPFLTGVFLLAVALDRVGVVGWLRALYASGPPIATIGVTSALGSALINNHPMSVLNAFALQGAGDTAYFAALIGGDLGPRLLPVGSLASLIWYAILRKHEVSVSLAAFVRTGIILTVPTLAVSLAVLWLLGLWLG
jgi:arsenical pump membrane protein